MPKDDAALLRKRNERLSLPELGSALSLGSVRPTQTSDRDALSRYVDAISQVRQGLAAQPVAGMEPVFESWMHMPNSYWDDAVVGVGKSPY